MDLSRLAKSIVDQVVTDEQPQAKAPEEGKNPAAVSLGRLVGSAWWAEGWQGEGEEIVCRTT
jgi:hypothetical protein